MASLFVFIHGTEELFLIPKICFEKLHPVNIGPWLMIACFAPLWIFVLGFIDINPIMRRSHKKPVRTIIESLSNHRCWDKQTTDLRWNHGALPSPITVTPSAADFPRDSSHSPIKYHCHDWFYDHSNIFIWASVESWQSALKHNVVVWCCHHILCSGDHCPNWSVSGGLAPSNTCLSRGPGQTFYHHNPSTASLFVKITKKNLVPLSSGKVFLIFCVLELFFNWIKGLEYLHALPGLVTVTIGLAASWGTHSWK